MMLRAALLAVPLLMPAVGVALAETVRSKETPIQFMRLHPCPGGPDKGHTEGTCRGYVRDHIIALCKNGPDTVANMQWQDIAAGHAKKLHVERLVFLERTIADDLNCNCCRR